MRRPKYLYVPAIALCCLTLSAAQVLAIPAFAKKYGFNCGMCHVAWPRLNDFGQKFRMNGYHIPGDESTEKTIAESGVVPIAMRTMAGYTSDKFSPEDPYGDVSQFRLNGLDLFAAGVLGLDNGFFLAYKPRIEGGSGVEDQAAEMEQANVVFNRLKGTRLNARIGRMEAAYVPFSQLRSISISPYEIYAFNGSATETSGSANAFALADTADGLELSWYELGPWQYSFGLVNGARNNKLDDGPGDIYLRGTYTVGNGFGQSTGHRFGLTVYFGRARAFDPLTMELGARHGFNRLGFDANLNRGPYNVEFQFVQGHDSGAFNIARPGKAYKFSGGFLQLNHFEKESARFARYDWVNTPSEDHRDISRIIVGWRQNLEYGLMLQLEYSHRKQDNGAGPGSDLTENFATARLDWAF